MSERNFHAEAVRVRREVDYYREISARECKSRLRGDDLIRQMVEMSKEEGLVDFSGWIKAAEKYLEGK